MEVSLNCNIFKKWSIFQSPEVYRARCKYLYSLLLIHFLFIMSVNMFGVIFADTVHLISTKNAVVWDGIGFRSYWIGWQINRMNLGNWFMSCFFFLLFVINMKVSYLVVTENTACFLSSYCCKQFLCFCSINSYFLVDPEGKMILQQDGTFRTNCIDCLDRTNVVQSLIARRSIQSQLQVRSSLIVVMI